MNTTNIEVTEQEKTFTIELTEKQMAIIKAGLKYYWFVDDFGYALWGTIPMACFGTSDYYYARRVGEIYETLNKTSKIKPDFGVWGNIKTISKLCMDEYKKAKKEGKEAEQRMYHEAIYDESIKNEINKAGLNGREILVKAAKVCREKLELERKNLQAIKNKNHGKSKNVA